MALGALYLEKDFGCFHLGGICAFGLGKDFGCSLLRVRERLCGALSFEKKALGGFCVEKNMVAFVLLVLLRECLSVRRDFGVFVCWWL